MQDRDKSKKKSTNKLSKKLWFAIFRGGTNMKTGERKTQVKNKNHRRQIEPQGTHAKKKGAMNQWES